MPIDWIITQSHMQKSPSNHQYDDSFISNPRGHFCNRDSVIWLMMIICQILSSNHCWPQHSKAQEIVSPNNKANLIIEQTQQMLRRKPQIYLMIVEACVFDDSAGSISSPDRKLQRGKKINWIRILVYVTQFIYLEAKIWFVVGQKHAHKNHCEHINANTNSNSKYV